jgi:single-strand DNA-binding protein
MLNHVVLIGRLTKDPQLRYTPNGVAVASFTLAVDRFRSNAQGKEETDFIPIVVWQKQAENCAEYLGTGSLCAVYGRIQVRTYDAKDGTRRWVTEIIAQSVQFLGKNGPTGKTKENSSGGMDSIGSEVYFDENDMPF